MKRVHLTHIALDPFRLPENEALQIAYSEDMCANSLDILSRAVLIGMHPDNDREKVDELATAIRESAKEVLS